MRTITNFRNKLKFFIVTSVGILFVSIIFLYQFSENDNERMIDYRKISRNTKSPLNPYRTEIERNFYEAPKSPKRFFGQENIIEKKRVSTKHEIKEESVTEEQENSLKTIQLTDKQEETQKVI